MRAYKPESIVYDGALEFQLQSQDLQASLIAEFEALLTDLPDGMGEIQIIDNFDGQVWLRADGRFYGRVLVDGTANAGTWQELKDPVEIIEFYDATDIFVKLAKALERRHPEHVARSDGAWDEYVAG